MKNQILLSLSIIFLFFSCQNATNKIKETSSENDTNIVKSPKNNTITDNSINAQIIDDAGGANFKFTNSGGTVWDFGTIKQGDSPEFTFTFINNGNEPMIISNAKGSCGCTVPQWPKEPIAPGSQGEISVQFNSKGKKGSQNKTVTLTANTTPPTTKLRVTGQIEVTE
tara:strand:+ start:3551 stop:4054 length:504 start_codon:yes stop_codon:yes gene_type:complete